MPLGAKIPSEHSVENLSNHFILEALAQPKAWLYCPTPAEEKTRGYDAKLKNHKVILIQYKALKYLYANGDVKIAIDPIQLGVLQAAAFGKCNTAFYGFCVLPSYNALDANFLAAPPQTFFSKCLFVDAMTIPNLTEFLRGNLGGFVARNAAGPIAPVATITGPQLCAGIKACSIGLPLGGLPRGGDGENARGSKRLTALLYPMSSSARGR
ncbi:hypothetical protein SAMN05518800_3216 [Variovorax sp. YR752]|uniref:hypothetical protein n=1 Tax=Variovorax sp. YR752 TaxID=1884383 RepID=UPI000BD83263|nr:hypothetical protein [Variovorax sp. YR752]SOD27652.1 hypothetical protein SAMN05518800_3216 [Variovorax sp. YR752]